MEVFVGTSGWAYSWNKENSLDWYINNSGLNAIELNMSFYRFPYPNMVKSWFKKGKNLAWVVKVHRSITHYKKLKKDSYNLFKRFKEIFKPLEDSIHYYLFQLPPSFNKIEALDLFIDEFGCEKICVEFREKSLFNDTIIQWGKKNGILIASIDAPGMPDKIMSEKIVYERIHGRTAWYSHNYSEKELLEIKNKILMVNPEKVYVFFNNNHAMLENAKIMYSLFL
ncbi:MAG: DUF72 domain-containing protein [Thermoplasmatota archaeon]|jgi:uncharacterized protein YecE (DUF72 family)